ncbi:MAG TPA: GWxTD domain-containing protein [Candidatus Glassbacteria bacterium]|nr:GWxTD domain-containing protein [Candidatus Glassbacteria bacterium]
MLKQIYMVTSFYLVLSIWPRAGGCDQSPGPGSPADSVFRQALSDMALGDTTAARALLDRAVELDPSCWEARLARGQLKLAAGDRGGAELDFQSVMRAKSAALRSRAYLGLGDIQASRPNRNLDAIEQYRLAIKVDPTDLDAYLHAARASLAIDDPKGYRVASGMLLDLIERDPTYGEAYETWRNRILDKGKGEMRRVNPVLERWVSGHPEKYPWLLDAAGYWYEVEEIDSALAILDRLAAADSVYKTAERYLLRARCLVELDDTLGFESAYQTALAAAEQTGDFGRLTAQAEAIFRPEEERKARQVTGAEAWAEFFQAFWARRDPDPLTPVNERLFEHYRRLRYAQKAYGLHDVYSKTRTSKEMNRKETFQNWQEVGGGGFFEYEYDPDLLWNRYPELALQQRGFLYLRHGPPDLISKPITEDLGAAPPNEEVWFYGGVFFPFREGHYQSSIGDYQFVPVYAQGMANIKKAMENESFKDPLPAVNQEFYAVDFMAPAGGQEFEVYQSAPLTQLKLPQPPGSSLAVFDDRWQEVARDSGSAFKAFTGGDSLWIGVNRVRLEPGKRILAARLDIPDRRAVQRQSVNLIPYHGKGLELSGIILGSPIQPGGQAHVRRGVEILPRPSLKYHEDEIITVYLEVYGLGKDESGERHYEERVTITRAGDNVDDKESLVSFIGSLIKKGDKLSSLTLAFERQPEEAEGTVAERFTVDTSMLLPGEYRMRIEVIDMASHQRRQAGCFFELGKGD